MDDKHRNEEAKHLHVSRQALERSIERAARNSTGAVVWNPPKVPTLDDLRAENARLQAEAAIAKARGEG